MQITIDHLDALHSALDAAPAIAAPIVQEASDTALLGLIPLLATYPAPPSGSRYRRTGTLGRLWTAARPEFQTLGAGWSGSIGNATPYGPFVQDATQQARAHRGRWTTDEQAVAAHAVEITRAFDAALQRVADALDARTQG